MRRPKTGATQYQAQLGIPDTGRAIKGLVVQNTHFIIGVLPQRVTILDQFLFKLGKYIRKNSILLSFGGKFYLLSLKIYTSFFLTKKI